MSRTPHPPLMDQPKRMEFYCLLMEEAKIRFNVVNSAGRNDALLPAPLVREICYLQFRMLCEIIALACLVAHGDIPETHALRNTYEPGKIIQRLGSLNPHFYPQPMEAKHEAGGHRLTGRPDILHLEKRELPKLWGKSGDILHRSPMVKMFKQMETDASDLSDILEWNNKLTGLLTCHWISLTDKRAMLVELDRNGAGKTEATMLDFSIEDGRVGVHTVKVA